MTAKRCAPAKTSTRPPYYRGAEVSMSMIRRFARQIAERFQPERIILFGSHAYGRPHKDSDVDVLVVMHTGRRRSQSARIRTEIQTPFAMDLLVRTPEFVKRRLAEGDSFLADIMSRGIVLYEKSNQGMGAKGRSRLSGHGSTARVRPACA